MKINLSKAEYEHVITAIEGAIEEFVEIEDNVDWFSTLTIERLEDALELLRANLEN